MNRIFILIIILTVLCFSLYAQNGYVPVITVLDFELNGLSQAEGRIFIDYLSSHVSAIRGYRFIDRSQREAILEEMSFSLSGSCSDEECQLEIGKMLAADYIIVGSIGTLGNRYLLNTRLIKVETSETQKSASEKYSSIDDLVDDSERLIKVLFNLTDEDFSSTETSTPLYSTETSTFGGDQNGDDYMDSVFDYLDVQTQTLNMPDGSVYEGEVFLNMPHGYGFRSWSNGDYFEGQFVMGLAADGYVYFADLGYSADYVQDLNGQWIELIDPQEITWDNGSIYFGEAINKTADGYGCLYYADGSIESGYWVAGKLSGGGSGEYSSGSKYSGQYKMGYFDGFGEFWDAYGNYYSGQFSDGYYNGEGMFIWYDGTMYKGNYENGRASGGVIYFPDGTIANGYQAENGDWITGN